MSLSRADRAWLTRRAVRPTAWFVLCELVDRDRDIVHVASRELARDLRLGRDAIRAALRELEVAGLIVPSVVRDDAGRFGPRAYVVLPAPAASRPAPENPPVELLRRRAPRATEPTAPTPALEQLSLLDRPASA